MVVIAATETIDPGVAARRKAKVRANLEAAASVDVDAVLATLGTPRYELVATGKIYEGEGAVRGYLEGMARLFSRQRFEIKSLYLAESAVIVEMDFQGIHTGTIGDVAPGGRNVRCAMSAIYQFEGEDLTQVRIYWDLATIARQLA